MLSRLIRKTKNKSGDQEQAPTPAVEGMKEQVHIDSIEAVVTKICELADESKLTELNKFLLKHSTQFPIRENLTSVIGYLIARNNLAALIVLVNSSMISPAEMALMLIMKEKYAFAKKIIAQFSNLNETFALSRLKNEILLSDLQKFITSYESKSRQMFFWGMLLNVYACVGESQVVNEIIRLANTEEAIHELKVLAAGSYAANNFPGEVRNLVTWEDNRKTQHDMLMAAVKGFAQRKDGLQIYFFWVDDFDDDKGLAIVELATEEFLNQKNMAAVCFILKYAEKEHHAKLYSLIAKFILKNHTEYVKYIEFIEAKLGKKVKKSILALAVPEKVITDVDPVEPVVDPAIERFRQCEERIIAMGATHNIIDLYALFNQETLADQLRLKKFYVGLICRHENALAFINSLVAAETDVHHRYVIKNDAIMHLVKQKKNADAVSIVDSATTPANKLQFQKRYLNFFSTIELDKTADYIATADPENEKALWIWVGRVFAANNRINCLNEMYKQCEVAKTQDFRDIVAGDLDDFKFIPADKFEIIPIIMKFTDVEFRRTLLALKNIPDIDDFLRKAPPVFDLANRYAISIKQADALCFLFKFCNLQPWFLFKRDDTPKKPEDTQQLSDLTAANTAQLDIFSLPPTVYVKITSYVLGVSDKRANEIQNEYLNIVPENFYRYSLFKNKLVDDTKLLYTQPLEITKDSLPVQVEAYNRYKSRIGG